MIARLGDGQIQLLCNCGLISEGLDVPNDPLRLRIVSQARQYKWGWLYHRLNERGLADKYRETKQAVLEFASED